MTTVGRLAAHVAYAAGRLAAPAAEVQACKPVTVAGAEQLTAVDRFWLARQEAVVRTVEPAAHVAYAVGRLEAPAAATQAWRPVTVVGAEQLTAVVRFWLTKQDAVLATLVPTVQLIYAGGRLGIPAAATQP